ncbi:hypothetical protein K501DRAFT_284604 [Backusella circina FSU 941]|nr:hypothetical protein K501DRAFT_284604 [Backusella circina FSU 941]
MKLYEIPEIILTQVSEYLNLKDLLSLADSHDNLSTLVYTEPKIWTSDRLFPPRDDMITDQFVRKLVPRITRHYGILELKMIDLPLTWSGYLMIFDQFAHSVNKIEIKATEAQLYQLAHHLSIFAGNLAMLQQNNKIPITFRQYALDDEEEYIIALSGSNYLGQDSLHNLNRQLRVMKLDDPPFERLNSFQVSGIDHSVELIGQLEFLASFLSGRSLFSVKRQREEPHHLEPIKHMKHHLQHPTPSYT